MDFVHLQVRSGYSLMKSTNTIEKLVVEAKEKGYTALALTDEGVMYGAVSFYQACRKHGIKPIVGLSIQVTSPTNEPEELVLLAKNNSGYEQLLQLSSYIQMSKLNAVEKKDLVQYTNGCIGILPLYDSTLHPLILQNNELKFTEAVNEWRALFDQEDFYLGIEDHAMEEERHLHVALEEFIPVEQIPLVAINDVRYIKEEDALALDCLHAIQANSKWSQEITDHSIKKRHLRSKSEMGELFGEWKPELLHTSIEIANKCSLELSMNRMMLPKYPVPSEESSDEYLKQLCLKGLQKRYQEPTNEIKERLSYELEIIQSMQFSDYFLIVWDFMSYASRHRILTGPGRGSAAGSLVAYLLDITNVDPIKYELLFERFLNPERITMPDIDIDFSDTKRDQVIQYVKDKYGAEHVAQIITFGTFGARSIIRELIKAMGVDSQEAAYLMKFIPQNSSQTVVEIVRESRDLQVYIQQSETLKLLFKMATRLEGLPRHASTHAAGVVISEQPLMKHVALTEGHNGVPLTQYAMNELEAIGLLKMDFLGLRNLTLIERITKSIEENEGKKVDLPQVDFEDEAAYQLLKRGKTTGIFQLESKGMRDVLQKLNPSHFEDVVAVNALYRPGPMEYIPTYIRRKNGKEEVTYPHPDLKPILNKTYGVLVYQEQIMQIAHQMAGFTLGQADLLRRAVSKKQQDVMMEQQQFFIQGCVRKGYTQAVAEEMFQWIVRFSNYGFNRSHAVAYSVISYQLAYLKAHYTAYFMAELMSFVSSDKIQAYMKEARDLNIDVLPPSINKSFSKFTVEKDAIRIGLSIIKGVGKNALSEIFSARRQKPFRNLFDFCRRVNLSIVNRQVLESLILSGCFDETHSNRASLLASIQHAMEQGDLFSEINDQESFFADSIDLDPTYVEMEPYHQLKQLSLESEVMGMYVTSHPLATYRPKLRKNGYISLQDAEYVANRKHLQAAVVIQELKTIRTKRGDPMAFLTLSDERMEMEAVLFPDAFREVRKWLKEEMIVFVKGRVEDRNGSLQWIVEEIRPFEDKELKEEAKQRLFLKLEGNDKEQIEQIKTISSQYPGNVPIIIHIAERKETFQLSEQFSIEPTYKALQALSTILGKDNVVLK